MKRLGVVLTNLGGPDSLEAVTPFLTNLFSDPAIIRVANPWRAILARFIARRRARAARAIYARLGGGSPLLANTLAQAAALEACLQDPGRETRVFIAMRYWHPFSDEAAAAVARFQPDQILLLPLYPQYSTTTTASSFAAWRAAAAKAGIAAPSQFVCCYPTEPGFIAALAELAKAGLEDLRARQAGEPAVIFTAHGLPERIVKVGDPYVEQVGASCRALASALGLGQGDWELGFQSRVGPLAWIGPGTDELIVAAGEAKKAILVVPVSFVSEHSETLVELDVDYGKLAADHGATGYVRVATVGTHPAFIAGLARIVRDAETANRPIVAFGAGCQAKACAMRVPASGPTTKGG
ncbi:MAG TPA: ferrochelatase [Candidatus Udaeobacter sp.]|nr:ferrochelatase [Candidatus Udaeobacter sp.]